MKETLLIYLFLAAMAATLLAMATVVLNMFVALKEPPSRRAAWVVGTPYLVIAIIFMVWGVDGYRASAPLYVLPGAAIAYWFWRGDYKARWYETVENMPDGVAVANDDWRVGLWLLAALVIAAIIKTAARHMAL